MTKKRFIAGAVCPRCAQMDKIVMYEKSETQYRECVSCGYQDEMAVAGIAREIPTRVSAKADKSSVAEQAINIIDPHKS